MFISLQINNVDALPADISPGYAARDRSFEIGRENCDWTLSDPDKFISGRHCEVRYQAGAFWLYDVSRNGTFINGSSQRMAGIDKSLPDSRACRSEAGSWFFMAAGPISAPVNRRGNLTNLGRNARSGFKARRVPSGRSDFADRPNSPSQTEN